MTTKSEKDKGKTLELINQERRRLLVSVKLNFLRIRGSNGIKSKD